MSVTESPEQTISSRVCKLLLAEKAIDAIYLYGSRAKGVERQESDWDLAVLFSNFEKDPVERVARAQSLEAMLERGLPLYGKISLIDLESVPPPLQFNAIRGIKWYDRGVVHVRKFENGVYSKIELDYA